MKKSKLIVKGVSESEKFIELDTAIKGNDLCKECKKNERKNGSSRCEECSINYKVNSFHKDRIARKVEETINK